jgi:3-methylcrotonyl-CoA carboxylase beta subunit
VKAAIGEDVDKETLGGATTQCEISGVTDYKMPDDKTCLDTIKGLVDKYGRFETAGFDRIAPLPPALNPKEILGIFPEGNAKPYNTLEILKRIVDNSELIQYKEGYGKTIICAYARIDGWAVGIVANQRTVVKNAKGEMQFGGVIYSDSADKAARFIMNCNQKKIPSCSSTM